VADGPHVRLGYARSGGSGCRCSPSTCRRSRVSSRSGASRKGLSLNRVISGYDGWTSERFHLLRRGHPAARRRHQVDGLRAREEPAVELGVYTNWLSRASPTRTTSARSWAGSSICRWIGHTRVALACRGWDAHRQARERHAPLKSKPEVFEATNFVDTGKFPASLGTIGAWRSTIATARGCTAASTTSAGQLNAGPRPFFQGGDAFVSWIVTGETRPYAAPLGTFKAISPARPVFKGGPGAFEAVLRASYRTWTRIASAAESSGASRDGELVLNDQARLEFSTALGAQSVRWVLQDGVFPGAPPAPVHEAQRRHRLAESFRARRGNPATEFRSRGHVTCNYAPPRSRPSPPSGCSCRILVFLELGRRVGVQPPRTCRRARRGRRGGRLGVRAGRAAASVSRSTVPQARFDARRELVGETANVAGTTWQRIDMLPPALQPPVRDGMRRLPRRADRRVPQPRSDAGSDRRARGARRAQNYLWCRPSRRLCCRRGRRRVCCSCPA
jgi:hypothetical protein